jgi:hypothetical protein
VQGGGKQEQTISSGNGEKRAVRDPTPLVPSSQGPTSTANGPKASDPPREAQRKDASEENGQREALAHMLAHEPPSVWRPRARRRQEIDGSMSMNSTEMRRDISPSRTVTFVSLTTYSSGASTLPPPYVEYD